MQYLLMIYNDESKFQSVTTADITKMSAAYTAYTEALKSAGVVRAGERLKPSATATTVRITDGKTKVLNGPYAEAKEQLAGYYVIDVPDLDSALSWATRCPGASAGTVEVRPIWPMQ
jgi:hypothetical protein